MACLLSSTSAAPLFQMAKSGSVSTSDDVLVLTTTHAMTGIPRVTPK